MHRQPSFTPAPPQPYTIHNGLAVYCFGTGEPVTLRDWLRRPQGRTDWQNIARRSDYTPRLREIAVPTLVLCGHHDPQFPPACSQELAAHIPNARAVYFERSGHYPFLEEPDAFWRAVREFWGTGA